MIELDKHDAVQMLTSAHTLHHSKETTTVLKTDSSILKILTDAKKPN